MIVRALFSSTMILGLITGLAWGGGGAEGARQVAAAYLDAMEAPDLDAAALLFAEDSVIFETGGTEGSWEHYRQHHLGPEIDSITSFAVDRGDPSTFTSQNATMVTIAWPVSYRIVLADEKTVNSKGTITFVLIREADNYRIIHLHWSSRRSQPSP